MLDNNDYAKGTRVRKFLGFALRPILRLNLRVLLWLCPDTPIVANVHIGKMDAGIYIPDGSIDGHIICVRLSRCDNYGITASPLSP